MPNDTGTLWRRVSHQVRELLAAEGVGTPGAGSWRSVVVFWAAVARSFNRNRGPLQASALAYSSLLAFVPLLAVVIGISTSLLRKDADRIRIWIDHAIVRVAPQLQNSEEVGLSVSTLVQKVNEMVDNVNSGTLNATGMIGLLVMILLMLGRIEESFNDIWGVTRGRTWYSRLVNYWAAISLGPIVLTTVLALTSGAQSAKARGWLDGLPWIGSLSLHLVPILLLGGAAALFYQLMPNTRVSWRAALIGGLVAGTLGQVNNWLSVLYVSQVATNSKIYGPLGLVPVLIVGLYLFWLILLFGAQVACTWQNRRSLALSVPGARLHQEGRELAALRLMTAVAGAYEAGERPPTLRQLERRLGLPTPLAAPLVATLVERRLLVEVGRGETGYLPGRPAEDITCAAVLDALRTSGGTEPRASEDRAEASAREALARMREAALSEGRTTVRELLERGRAE